MDKTPLLDKYNRASDASLLSSSNRDRLQDLYPIVQSNLEKSHEHRHASAASRNAAQFERFRHGGYGCEYLPRSIESGCKEARVSGGFMREEFGVRMGGNLNT
ncbi:hypothetical protein WN943_018880 [Citrus x changshan-huyou]